MFNTLNKFLKTPFMLFPILAYTNYLQDSIFISLWISILIISPAIIMNKINISSIKNYVLGVYLLIISIFLSLTYFYMYYITPSLYSNWDFSIPSLMIIIITFHKNEPFKTLNTPKVIWLYSRKYLINYLIFANAMALIRELFGRASLEFLGFNLQILPSQFKVEILNKPSGAILLIALFLAILKYIINKKTHIRRGANAQ